MELKDFVKETILSLHNSILEINTELQNEYESKPDKQGIKYILGNSSDMDCSGKIDFEVIIGIEESSKGNVGAKLKVLSLVNIGADGELSSKQYQTNKIKFTVRDYGMKKHVLKNSKIGK